MRAAKAKPVEPFSDGIVTSLKAQRGRSDRIAVYIDGSRAFDLAAVVADRAGLRCGDALDVETQQGLLREDAPYRARDRALAFLAARERSSREVEVRLRTVGFEPEVIRDTVVWLQGLDYLSDERFATHYATEKLRGGWGEHRISSELRRKGVDRAVVEEALGSDQQSNEDAAEGVEAVVRVVRRRFARQFETDPDGASRRLAGYLGRRGYDWDTIHTVSRKLIEEGDGECSGPCP